MLCRISAPHFVAGLVLEDDVVVAAAPILKWSIGKSRAHLRRYFNSKGWKAEIVHGHR